MTSRIASILTYCIILLLSFLMSTLFSKRLKRVFLILKDTKTLNELLNKLKIKINKVAIEINGMIIEKNKYSNLILNKDDKVEIVKFIGGG